MIFTSEMIHLTAIVLRERADAVSEALLRIGAVQFSRLAETAPDLGALMSSVSVDERRAELAETRRRIESLLTLGGIASPAAVGDTPWDASFDVAEVNARIDRLAHEVERFRSRQADIQRQINRITDVRRQLEAFAPAAGAGGDASALTNNLMRSGNHQYLDIRYGRIPENRLSDADRAIAGQAGIIMTMSREGGDAVVLVLAMKRNAAEVQRILSESGFRAMDIPKLPDEAGEGAIGRADEKLTALRAEQDEQAANTRAIISDRRSELESDWRRIRVVELMLSIRGMTSESSHATVLGGWVPLRKRDRVESVLRAAAGEACVLEWHTPAEFGRESGKRMRVPVELRNPQFLRPFQMLVTNFGVPEYGTIDPTPLVAVAYLVMFGLMFGDAGHGLILILLGLLGTKVMKKPGMYQLSKLLIWCGGASIVMGVLFGAYFGYELMPALWFNYHGVVAGHPSHGSIANIMDILKLTVLLGVGVISAGLLLNWINRIRTRDWKALFFAKEGVLGGIIYGTGVWVAYQFSASGFRFFPDLSVAGPLILVPVIILFLKFPFEAAAAKRSGGHGHSPLMWIMDWAIEMLEIFSGYLANTLSFMRVAGLGIAHVMLMVAFFQIAEMISPGRTSILSIIVLLFGNALVIALEGLSAGIQSLRLNYYEFFSKYFTPTGIEFRPVSLETQR